MKRTVSTTASLTLVLVVLWSSNVAASSSRITFGLAPANVTGVDGRSQFTYAVTPGASVKDRVALLNYSLEPIVLHVGAVDASESSKGAFSLDLGEGGSNGVGAWVSIGATNHQVLVPAATSSRPGEALVLFSLKVPLNATPGDHVGGITAALETRVKNHKGDEILVEDRVGARVFVTVSGTFRTALRVRNLHVSSSGSIDPLAEKTLRVSYDVINTGNVDVALHQALTVSGPLASGPSLVPRTVSLVLPGAEIAEHETLRDVTAPLWATVGVEARGVQTPQVGPLRTVRTVASATLWTGTATVSVAAVIILLLGLIAWLRRRVNAKAAV